MKREDIIQADFQAKAGLLEAERTHIRSQINLLEAQLKQNGVRVQELEFQWKEFVASLQAKEQAPESQEAAMTQSKKETKKAVKS